MRHLRGGYEAKHRQHATDAPIIRDHRENHSFSRPSAFQLNAAAVLASAAMIAGVAGPASAAQETTRPASAQAAVAISETVPIVSNEGADRYVRLRDGRFIVDTPAAAEADDLSGADALAAYLNRLIATPARTGGGIVLTAATKATTYDLLPGVVLTVGSDYVQLALSKQVVTEIENLASVGQGIAGLVGAILAVSQVPGGSEIAAIVADSIGIGDDAFKLCVGPNGNATFLVSAQSPFLACTGLSDLAA